MGAPWHAHDLLSAVANDPSRKKLDGVISARPAEPLEHVKWNTLDAVASLRR